VAGYWHCPKFVIPIGQHPRGIIYLFNSYLYVINSAT
jgi:hypothetical protein